MNQGLLYLIILLSVLFIIFLVIERKQMNSKEIALISVMASMAALSRIPFVAIPNAQPTTFFVIISGIVFGWRSGFLVGVMAALVSNIFLGHGPWTVSQMAGWGFGGVSAGILFQSIKYRKRKYLVLFGIIFAYFYGWLMNCWYWFSFVYPLNLSTFAATQLTSFWFDSIHAISNAVFFYLFGEKFIGILYRFRLKLSYNKVQ